MGAFDKIVEETKRKRAEGAQQFAEHDTDLCMICHAHGEDKRSLFISCFYNVQEVVPEALDIQDAGIENFKIGFYLRICKTCRGELLRLLGVWRANRITERGIPLDHDGGRMDDYEGNMVPVRVNGAIIHMTEEEYARWYKEHGL